MWERQGGYTFPQRLRSTIIQAMSEPTPLISIKKLENSAMPRVTWSLLLFLLLGGVLTTTDSSLGIISLAVLIVCVLIAWNIPYIAFYISLATAPLIGFLVSLPTGSVRLGERAFGGAIDISVGEVVAGIVVFVWALRLLLLWRGRQDKHWHPWLPLLGSYGLLVLAHIASVLSPTNPDPILVIKYALRPVFLAYLLYVILPVNFLKSKRRLMSAMSVLMFTGIVFALDGFRSLFTFREGELFRLHRARPLPILGVSPIGDNHNVLAEFLLFTAPLALALAIMAGVKEEKKFAIWCGVFMYGVALLTFARSAWIVFVVQILILAATVWKDWIKEHVRQIWYGIAAFTPLAAYMAYFSLTSEVQSSTDARAMLTEIGVSLFKQSPLFGIGAGTWVERVGQTWMFVFEFGTPMDSHGVIQKIAAETGLFGLVAFALVIYGIFRFAKSCLEKLKYKEKEWQVMWYLTAATVGAFVYQLFNTTYWTAKLWLPVGILFAAGKIFTDRLNTKEPDFLRGLDK